MRHVVIDIFEEYTCSAAIPNGMIIKSSITNINTIDGYLQEHNGLFALYIASKLPFATARTLRQKLKDLASEAMIHASNEDCLCTVTGGVKVMNKLLN